MWSLALAILLVAAPDQEYDVLRLKNGRTLKGFIVSETEDRIKFRVLRFGSKGEIIGGATAGFNKADIASIERASKKARDKAKSRSDAAGTHAVDYEAALQKFLVVPVRLLREEAVRVTGDHFVVASTCDERFAREITFYLEEVYKAYRKYFDVRRNAERKVVVYVLRDFAEYIRFQRARFGGAIQNPAFYYPKGNFIVACNLFPVEREREIRARVLGYERQVQEYKKEAKAFEDRIRREAIEMRREIDAEAARAERSIRADPGGNKNARLARVAQWKRQQKELVRQKEREAKNELKAYRAKASAYISENRGVLARNYRARLEGNKRMFECLFHEGFHAFSHNFLWRDAARVPRWLEEGLASYYEMSVVEVGELIHGGANPAFLALLRKPGTKRLPLAQVLKGDPRQFLVAHGDDTSRSSLYYAQSWSVAHYMVGRVPQERILAYADATARGADPVKTFAALMGAPIPRVEAAVERHLAALESE